MGLKVRLLDLNILATLKVLQPTAEHILFPPGWLFEASAYHAFEKEASDSRTGQGDPVIGHFFSLIQRIRQVASCLVIDLAGRGTVSPWTTPNFIKILFIQKELKRIAPSLFQLWVEVLAHDEGHPVTLYCRALIGCEEIKNSICDQINCQTLCDDIRVRRMQGRESEVETLQRATGSELGRKYKIERLAKPTLAQDEDELLDVFCQPSPLTNKCKKLLRQSEVVKAPTYNFQNKKKKKKSEKVVPLYEEPESTQGALSHSTLLEA